MEDLSLIAMLFKTSSTLEQAAAALEKMPTSQEKISGAEKKALSWSGEFLLAVDWSTQQAPPKPVGGGTGAAGHLSAAHLLLMFVPNGPQAQRSWNERRKRFDLLPVSPLQELIVA
jgi:hypothetical protein